jgi:hypothetical protein
MKKSFNKLLVTPLIAFLLAGFVLLPVAEVAGAPRGGGGGGGASRAGGGGGGKQSVQGGGGGKQNVQADNSKRDARTDNVRSTSTSNVNRSTDVNRSANVDVDVEGGWDDRHHHPVAGAAAVTATAVVVGSMVSSVPANCVPVTHNNVVYQQCGSTWYQPQYVGNQVQYEVVNPPR